VKGCNLQQFIWILGASEPNALPLKAGAETGNSIVVQTTTALMGQVHTGTVLLCTAFSTQKNRACVCQNKGLAI